MHFAEDQVFWECHELKASERFTDGIPTRYVTSVQRHLLRSQLASEDPRKLLEIWDSITATYTASDLTYTSDKLVGISALARHVSSYSPIAGEYLAGMWKDQLIGQLLWSASNHTARSKQYRAPSWSWACLDGPIWPSFDCSGYGIHGSKYGSKPMIKIVDASVETGRDPYESVVVGTLLLSGPLLQVQLQPEADPEVIERGSAEAERARLESLMSRIEPNYEPGKVTTVVVSDGIIPDAVKLTMDRSSGVIAIDESGQRQLRSLGPTPSSGRDFQVSLGTHKIEVHLDEKLDSVAAVQFEFVVMPVLCFSEIDRVYNREGIEIESIRGLLLTPTGAGRGQYRRKGVCRLDEYAAAEFLCALGNQDPAQLHYENMDNTQLKIEDFVPKRWAGNELEFVPKEYARYQISVV